MKTLNLSYLALSILLTAVMPSWAQSLGDSSISTKVESGNIERLSELGVAVNPQLGVSSFSYSGEGNGKSKTQLSGGTTFEFGKGSRRLETGVLLLRTGSNVDVKGTRTDIESSFLTIPMVAKLRLISMRSQEWYLKLGVLTAFELNSSKDAVTNDTDILGSLGLGGRLAFTRQSDFIVEATFNRGLMDAVRGAAETYNQGFLILAGLSFNI